MTKKNAAPVQLDFSPPNVISVREALDRMAAALDSRSLADRELYHLLCIGDQLAFQRCHPRYGGDPTFEPVPQKFFVELLGQVPQTSSLGTPTSYAVRVFWVMRYIAEPRRLPDIMCWFFLDRDRFEKRYPAVNEMPPTQKQTNKSDNVQGAQKQKQTRKPPIEYLMIHAILKQRCKDGYDHIPTGTLEGFVRDGWEAECKARKVEHLIKHPPNRDKIDRALGRRKPR